MLRYTLLLFGKFVCYYLVITDSLANEGTQVQYKTHGIPFKFSCNEARQVISDEGLIYAVADSCRSINVNINYTSAINYRLETIV